MSDYISYSDLLDGYNRLIVTDMTKQIENTMSNYMMFNIEKVIFNDPATIVYWKDGTKTVVQCSEYDIYDAEKGLAMCYMKKALGNKGNFNEILKKTLDPDYNRQKDKKERKKAGK